MQSQRGTKSPRAGEGRGDSESEGKSEEQRVSTQFGKSSLPGGGGVRHLPRKPGSWMLQVEGPNLYTPADGFPS